MSMTAGESVLITEIEYHPCSFWMTNFAGGGPAHAAVALLNWKHPRHQDFSARIPILHADTFLEEMLIEFRPSVSPRKRRIS